MNEETLHSLAFLCSFWLHVPAPECILLIWVQAQVGAYGAYFQQTLELQNAIESYGRLPKSCIEGSKSESFLCRLR
ncbi:hypothetical protein XENTR_v10008983 [Xenopus tropicalis]|nr:hypothetical protein XENTR_v10008983 [Xenopus tropicalis]